MIPNKTLFDRFMDFNYKGVILVALILLAILGKDWLAGGEHYHYKTLNECLDGDQVWIMLLTGLSISIMIGYLVIAYFWFVNAQGSSNNIGRRLLNKLMYIFVFCSFCGYGFNVLNNFWPARRLQVIVEAALALVTWLFVRNIASVRIIFTDMHAVFMDKDTGPSNTGNTPVKPVAPNDVNRK